MASVLAIDDEPAICRLLSVFLTAEGHLVQTAGNGQEALVALAQGSHPDVILLDLCMPVMTGRAVIEAVRANRSWRNIPIIVLTASAPGSAQMPSPGTCNALLYKPFDLEELLALISSLTAPVVSLDAAASC